MSCENCDALRAEVERLRKRLDLSERERDEARAWAEAVIAEADIDAADLPCTPDVIRSTWEERVREGEVRPLRAEVEEKDRRLARQSENLKSLHTMMKENRRLRAEVERLRADRLDLRRLNDGHIQDVKRVDQTIARLREALTAARDEFAEMHASEEIRAKDAGRAPSSEYLVLASRCDAALADEPEEASHPKCDLCDDGVVSLGNPVEGSAKAQCPACWKPEEVSDAE